MNNDSQDGRKGKEPERTIVDLGEDLLEKSATWSAESRPAILRGASPARRDEATSDAPIDSEDLLHSARILVSEGLFEEAKKVLRRIRIHHPEEARARDMLEDIHAIELKQILGEEPGPRSKRRGGGSSDAASEDSDPETVLAELDHDLQLRLDESNRPLSPLFDDAKSIQEYADRLDRELADLSGRDRLDLGIAFFEMNLFEVAIRQFRAAHRTFLQQGSQNARDLLVCTGLIAHATIAVGRAFEATLLIQSVLRDAEIPLEDKLEFIYLMGRAYEQLKKPELAAQWFEQACKIDPHYRDADRRMKSAREMGHEAK